MKGNCPPPRLGYTPTRPTKRTFCVPIWGGAGEGPQWTSRRGGPHLPAALANPLRSLCSPHSTNAVQKTPFGPLPPSPRGFYYVLATILPALLRLATANPWVVLPLSVGLQEVAWAGLYVLVRCGIAFVVGAALAGRRHNITWTPGSDLACGLQ